VNNRPKFLDPLRTKHEALVSLGASQVWRFGRPRVSRL
jgi:hypothetical protein